MPVVHDSDAITMSADVDDHPYAGDSLDVTPTGAGFNFTGIDPNNGIATQGYEIVIVNLSAVDSFTIKHNAGASAAGNRFFFSDGLDHVLGPGEQVWGVRRETVAGKIGWWMQF